MTTTPSLIQIDSEVSLARFTTFGIGGPARFFTRADTPEALVEALSWAEANGHQVLILGGGSNMLVSDDGFDGLVIDLDLRGVSFTPTGDGHTLVEAAAGENWDELVASVVARELAGFECLSGIPGNVGATPIQNVGAYGQEVAETLVSLDAWDRRANNRVTLSNDECRFAYRDSRFKSEEPGRYVILAVRYRLRDDGEPTIRYPELSRRLADEGIDSPTLQEVRNMVLRVRASKGMVLDPDDPDSRSAGSFFTNPIVDASTLERFLDKVRRADVLDDGEQIPQFPAADGMTKLSAAWIIQHAGFHRGHVHGNVGLSSKHTLAIINRGGGTASEVRELVEQIQSRVDRLFGITLVPEPNFIGF